MNADENENKVFNIQILSFLPNLVQKTWQMSFSSAAEIGNYGVEFQLVLYNRTWGNFSNSIEYSVA